jgi:hypothetical protein
MSDLETYLLGKWQLTREIIDHHDGGDRLHLTGAAEMDRLPSGALSYFEQTTLETDESTLKFTRRYLYWPTGGTTASVEFENGSRFFELDLRDGRCRVRHLCDEDLYLGLIVTTDNGWYTRWRCRGPNKNYVATTYLFQAADPTSPSTV